MMVKDIPIPIPEWRREIILKNILLPDTIKTLAAFSILKWIENSARCAWDLLTMNYWFDKNFRKEYDEKKNLMVALCGIKRLFERTTSL